MTKANDSTADDRTRNNVVRHDYRTLTDAEKKQMKAVKDVGLDFIVLAGNLGASREVSLAITKIEEAVFWAVKHITGDRPELPLSATEGVNPLRMPPTGE